MATAPLYICRVSFILLEAGLQDALESAAADGVADADSMAAPSMDSDNTAEWVVAVLALTALGVSADEALGALSGRALADEAVSHRFCTASSHEERRVSAQLGASAFADFADVTSTCTGRAFACVSVGIPADVASADTISADTARPLFTGQVFATRTRRTREGDGACFGLAER